MMRCSTALLAAACLVALDAPVQAQVTVGVLIGITGPGAAQGAGHKNSVSLLPAEIAGQTVTYLVRDDGGQHRAQADRRGPCGCVHRAGQHGVDSRGPADRRRGAGADGGVVAPCGRYGRYPHAFGVVQPIKLMVAGVVADMEGRGLRTTGFIGFGDGWGDLPLMGRRS